MNDEHMAYIARAECGCVCMAVVDTPAHKRDTAREIAKAVRAGDAIERVTVEQVRTMPWHCAEHPTFAALRKAQKVAKQEAAS